MRQKDFLKIIKYIPSTGGEIRITIADSGEPWFCAGDVLKVAGLEWGGHFLNRLSVWETRRLYCEGKSMRFVSTTGLLSLLAPKHEYLSARKAIVELIIKYSKKP